MLRMEDLAQDSTAGGVGDASPHKRSTSSSDLLRGDDNDGEGIPGSILVQIEDTPGTDHHENGPRSKGISEHRLEDGNKGLSDLKEIDIDLEENKKTIAEEGYAKAANEFHYLEKLKGYDDVFVDEEEKAMVKACRPTIDCSMRSSDSSVPDKEAGSPQGGKRGTRSSITSRASSATAGGLRKMGGSSQSGGERRRRTSSSSTRSSITSVSSANASTRGLRRKSDRTSFHRKKVEEKDMSDIQLAILGDSSCGQNSGNQLRGLRKNRPRRGYTNQHQTQEEQPQQQTFSRQTMEEEIMADIAELPAPVQPMPTLPGATAIGPDPSYQMIFSDGDLQLQSTPPADEANPTDHSRGLVEAIPVGSEHFAQAEPLTDSAHMRMSSRQSASLATRQSISKEWKASRSQCQRIVLVLLPLLLLVGLIIGLVLGLSSDENPRLRPAPTSVPSMAPSSPLNGLIANLPDYSLASLADPSSAQSLAYQWLLGHKDIDNLPDWRKTQLFALVTFFFAFRGPTHWQKLIRDDWLLDTKSECLWFSNEFAAVSPDGQSITFFEPFDPSCNEEGEFELLVLHGMDVSDGEDDITSDLMPAHIPPEIELLTSLKKIQLFNARFDAGTHLSDILPNNFYQHPSLEALSLARNSLGGPLPTELGLMTKLSWLWITSNPLTGSIPSQVGLMESMRELTLQDSLLSGWLPTEMGDMDSLWILNLQHSGISGPIPSELGKLETTLYWLALSNNSLSGPIPTQLGLVEGLVYFNASENSLSGSIPSELGMINNMTYLHLEMNKLAGSIPSQLGSMTTSERGFRSLLLSDNMFTGTIPTELSNLEYLEELNLSYAGSLRGPIPSELGYLTALTALDLGGNQLIGPIPSELGSLPNLKTLVLSHLSLLTGTIPLELGGAVSLSTLAVLQLDGCTSLSGTVPHEICWLGNATCTWSEFWFRPTKNCSLELPPCNSLFCDCSCECPQGGASSNNTQK